eukprot:6476708-Amphidinium_carterae.2
MASQGSDGLGGRDKVSRIHVESQITDSVLSGDLHVWNIAALSRALWVLNDVVWMIHSQDAKEGAFHISRVVGKQRELWSNLAVLLNVDPETELYDSRNSVRKTGKEQTVVKQDYLVSTDMLLVCLCAYMCSGATGRGHLPQRACALLPCLLQQFLEGSWNWSEFLESCEPACANACSETGSWCSHMQRVLAPLRSEEGRISDTIAKTIQALGTGMQHCKTMQLVLADVIKELGGIIDTVLGSGRFQVDEQDLHPPTKRQKHHPNEAWKDWVANAAMRQGRARRGTGVVRLQGSHTTNPIKRHSC